MTGCELLRVNMTATLLDVTKTESFYQKSANDRINEVTAVTSEQGPDEVVGTGSDFDSIEDTIAAFSKTCPLYQPL